MSSKELKRTKRDENILEHHSRDSAVGLDPDAEFGGSEARKKLEKRLLLKLDARMSILVVIYILNYVSCTLWAAFQLVLRRWFRLIGTTRRERAHPKTGIVDAEHFTEVLLVCAVSRKT